MAFTVDDHFFSEWQGTVQLLQQQTNDRLSPAVRVESASGEAHYFEQLGSTTVSEIATRHASTPLIEMDHRLRVVHPRFFVWSTVIDDEDKVRLLTDPTSIYNQNAVAGFNRKKDKIILDAALGTAYTGKGGATATVFDTNYQIAAGGTGLTKAKLITAMEKLMTGETEGPYYCAITADENSDLLNIPEVASGDFNNAKPLVEGKVQHYMGFNFIHTEQLGTTGGNQVVAWAKNSLGLAVWKNMEMNNQKDPNYNYNYRPHIKYFMGATRLDEVGVVEILCA